MSAPANSLVAMREWFSPAELAEMRLRDLPDTARNINDIADRDGWRTPGHEFPGNPQGYWRQRAGRGGGYEYRIDVLKSTTKADLTMRLAAGLAEPRPIRATKHAERWAWYDALPESKKAKARRKLEALLSVDAMTMAGDPRDIAMQVVAVRAQVSLRTLYNWQDEVRRVPKADWLPHLAPRHFGSAKRTEIDERAWDWYRAQYLRQEEPSHAESYRLLKEAAKEHGWTIPSAKTLERRVAELPKTTLILSRKGPKAIDKLYPAQERDRSVFHALEAVNSDTHTWDVFVEWWDGEILRVSMCAWQDLYSGKFLSWRFDKAPNKDMVRLSFLDVVEKYGIPEHCVFDNGRENASKWITGGAPNRYRFKVREEEPLGVVPGLGCEVHWAQPYRGQAKPIERGFKDFAMNIAKHPAFAGAWTGNTIANKPENYGSKAVHISKFVEIVEQRIADHNQRKDRKTKVCGGKRSFDEVFQESYAVSPIRQASVAQKRMLLLAPEMVTARKPDGAVYVAGNRYWSDFLVDQMGRKVILRLDPQNLHAGVHVERADGAYLGFAACVEAVGFFDSDAAREHARAKGDWLKAQRTIAKAEKRMTIEEVAALLPEVKAPEPTEPRVVRPIFGANGNAALKIEEEEDERDAVLLSFRKAVSQMAHPGKRNGTDE